MSWVVPLAGRVELSEPPSLTNRIEPKRWRGTEPHSAEKITKAREMEAAGVSRNEISAALGISRCVLWRRLGKKSHWDRRKKK